MSYYLCQRSVSYWFHAERHEAAEAAAALEALTGAKGADGYEDLRPVMMSTFTFVDLAGSERSTQSEKDDGMDRLRLKEVGLEANRSCVWGVCACVCACARVRVDAVCPW
jgi:hypothetical protein